MYIAKSNGYSMIMSCKSVDRIVYIPRSLGSFVYIFAVVNMDVLSVYSENVDGCIISLYKKVLSVQKHDKSSISVLLYQW